MTKKKQMVLVAIAAVGLAGFVPTGESSSTASSSLEAVSSSSEEGVASSESAASNGRKRAIKPEALSHVKEQAMPPIDGPIRQAT